MAIETVNAQDLILDSRPAGARYGTEHSNRCREESLRNPENLPVVKSLHGSSCGAHRGELELAKRKSWDAQRAFERYLRRGRVDLEQHKRLAEALRAAVDEYIDKVAMTVAG